MNSNQKPRPVSFERPALSPNHNASCNMTALIKQQQPQRWLDLAPYKPTKRPRAAQTHRPVNARKANPKRPHHHRATLLNTLTTTIATTITNALLTTNRTTYTDPPMAARTLVELGSGRQESRTTTELRIPSAFRN